METLLKNGSQLYAFVYFGAIIVVALLESVLPRRAAGNTLGLRWFGNFSLTIIGAILVRALFPLVGVGWAVFCSERGLGLFNQVTWPPWSEFALTIVAIDAVYYVQHYMLHRIPMLWRLHRTHHSDQEYDFTTGVRFHPFEAVYTTAVLLAAILALGAPPVAVLASQLLSVAVGVCRARQPSHPLVAGPCLARDRRHARHAPHSPFTGHPRGRVELLEYVLLVGPPVWHLRRSACRRARRHRVWHRGTV